MFRAVTRPFVEATDELAEGAVELPTPPTQAEHHDLSTKM